MESNRDGNISRAISLLCHCTDDEIRHHGQQMDLLVSRVRSLRGQPEMTSKSRLLTARGFLNKVEESLKVTVAMEQWNMVEFAINAMRKEILSKNENASLAFSSLGRRSSEIHRQLHVQSALYHVSACYESVDHLARSSNREDFYLGKIPAYCSQVNADIAVMRRCIRTGSKVDYLRQVTGQPGIAIVVTQVAPLLGLVTWPVLQEVSTLMDEYPVILETSHDLNDQGQKSNVAYRYV